MTTDTTLGMDRHTGRAITDEITYIRQSIADVLTTLVGTRIERRDYGSVLPLLIDHPLGDATLLRAYVATIVAVQQWLPDITVNRVEKRISTQRPGNATFVLTAQTRYGPRDILVDLGRNIS